jgi:hypothetical protein
MEGFIGACSLSVDDSINILTVDSEGFVVIVS